MIEQQHLSNQNVRTVQRTLHVSLQRQCCVFSAMPSFEPVFPKQCLAALDLGAGVEQSFNYVIIQNRQAVLSVFPLRCATAQMRSTTRQFAQCYLILAHAQHSKLSTACAIDSPIGTLHCLCVCMAAQLHALSAQKKQTFTQYTIFIEGKLRAVHEEVERLDIRGQHGRRFVLLRHTHRPPRRPYPICASKRKKRPTLARNRLSRIHAVLVRVIPGWWVPVSGMKVRSLVVLFSHSAFHRWSAHSSGFLFLLLDELISCCAGATNACLDLRRHAFRFCGQLRTAWSGCPSFTAWRATVEAM